MMYQRFALAFICSLLASTLAASPTLAQQKLRPLAIGTGKFAAETPEYYAKKYGLFEKHGLDVTMTVFNNGADGIGATVGGSVQFTFSIPSIGMVAIQNGIDLILVAQQEVTQASPPDSGSLQVLAASPIKTVADLKGKTIGTAALSSQFAVAVEASLKRGGLVRGDYKLVEMPFVAMGNALKGGHVDAISLIEPFTTQTTSSGLGRVISWPYVEAVPGMPIDAWYARKSFVDQNPDVVEAFTAALRDAIDALRADPEKARAEVAAFSGLSPDLIKQMPISNWDYRVRLKNWDATIKMMADAGVLKAPKKAADYMAPQMLKHVVPD